jgi:ATP-dependent RNA helicase MSS116
MRTRNSVGSNKNDILCLILSPTRELAAQIAKEAEILMTYMNGSKVVTVVGGTNIKKDNSNLAGRVDILVATPGRLLDHLQQGLNSRFRSMQVLIMDEADQLLDMGFRPGEYEYH